MRGKILRVVNALCLFYVGLLLLSLAISVGLRLPDVREFDHSQAGCYWKDALVFFIECQGFWLSQATEHFLNAWLVFLYLNMFAVSSVAYFPTAMLAWLPVCYLVWYWLFGGRAKGQMPPDPGQP